ncbi:hypothetical protein [Notoacmeibacter marinus]|uniref:hypothetical protein n=1 Tax=Notoacmeibacter marinus TaxID=1876515 RepID=UPI0013B04D5F|nr:hypothetical protein [Notoacmeibacter marinus]
MKINVGLRFDGLFSGLRAVEHDGRQALTLADLKAPGAGERDVRTADHLKPEPEMGAGR